MSRRQLAVATVGLVMVIGAVVALSTRERAIAPAMNSAAEPTSQVSPPSDLNFATLTNLDPQSLEPFVRDIPEPHGLGVFEGKLYVSSWGSNQIEEIDLASGERRTVARGVEGAHDMVLSPDGQLVTTLFKSGRVVKIDRQSGEARELATGLAGPNGITLAPGGGYYVSNARGGTVIRLSDDGTVRPVLSDLREPAGLVTAGDAVLIAQFADPENAVIRLNADGSRQTVARGLTSAETLLRDSAGNLLISHVQDGRAAVSVVPKESPQPRVILTTNLPGPLVGPVTDGNYLYLESAGATQSVVYRIKLTT